MHILIVAGYDSIQIVNEQQALLLLPLLLALTLPLDYLLSKNVLVPLHQVIESLLGNRQLLPLL